MCALLCRLRAREVPVGFNREAGSERLASQGGRNAGACFLELGRNGCRVTGRLWQMARWSLRVLAVKLEHHEVHSPPDVKLGEQV
jgi:hypothetical protein